MGWAGGGPEPSEDARRDVALASSSSTKRLRRPRLGCSAFALLDILGSATLNSLWFRVVVLGSGALER